MENVTVTGTDDLNITIDASQSGDVPVIRGIQIVAAGGDLIPPVITLLGNDVEAVSLGGTYTDAGATALDDVDRDITSNINVVNPVDTNTVGIYEVTYNVSDTAGNAAAEVTRTVYVIENDTPLYRVNNGGPDIDMSSVNEPDFFGLTQGNLTAITGLTATGDFQSDPDAGNVTIVLSLVNPNLPQALFQTANRTSSGSGDLNFAFAVPNGDYDVILHWSEQNSGFISIGDRVFDVLVEGSLVLDNYDIAAATSEAGINVAVSEIVPTTVTDGQLLLTVTAQTCVAIIRGIEIVPTDVPTAVSLQSFSHKDSERWQSAVLVF